MKASGVEWLGEIPQHWNVKRLKYVCSINPSKTETKFLSDELEVTFLPMESIGVGVANPDQSKKLVEVSQGFTFFANDDVVIAKITPCFENGKGAIVHNLVNKIGFGTTELHVLRAHVTLNNRFLYYLTASYPFRKLGEGEMQGTAGQKRVTGTFINNFATPLPPLPEQHAIADFLDHETARIDTVIAKYQRLLELLEEKRINLIALIVTRGLDSSALMKKSELPWLRNVPAHWNVVRNGNLFEERDERNQSDLPLLNVSIHTGVTLREFSTEHIEQMASDWSTYKMARKGDIAFNKMRMWQGAVGVAPVDGLVSPDYTVACPRENVNPYYFEYLFRTETYKNEINRFSHGIVPDRNRLYWEQFKQMPSLCPPFKEQNQIVEYLNEKSRQIDQLAEKINQIIFTLKEYRNGLISSAVTGKINVSD